MNTIVLTGGGTAGHVMPALALVPYLRKYFARIAYTGASGGVEERLATAADLPFWGTRTIKFDRERPWRNLAIPRVLHRAAGEMATHLEAMHCDVVFSKGGYCALPTVLAAHRLGLPIVCHESDLSLGLANRLSLRYTRHLITSFDSTPGGVFMGNPIRDEVFEGRAERVAVPMPAAPTVLVMGGSMGARTLNEMAVALCRELPTWNVLNLYGNSPIPCARPNYVGVSFTDRIADYYARAEVVVCRAGANTLFELAALTKPTVTIPLPKGTSRGDQEQNAAYFGEKYGFTVLSEAGLTPDTVASAVLDAREGASRHPAFSASPNARIARYIYDVFAGVTP